MIVRSGNNGEVQLVGQRENALSVSGGLRHAARRAVRAFDRGQTDRACILVDRDANDVTRYRKKEDWRNRSGVTLYHCSLPVGRRDFHSSGVRSEQDRMFAVVPKLDSRKKRHPVASQ